jgi:His/Glu/Gln/Arg/opine family amino acid ABC transporter permease subunit
MTRLDVFLDIISSYWPAFLKGTTVTLAAAAAASLFGLASGIPIGWIAGKPNRFLRGLLGSGKWFLSVVPLLIIIMWVYYPLQSLTGIDMGPFWSTVVALAAVNLLIVGQVVCDARQTVPHELRIASEMYGGSFRHLLTRVEGPFVLRIALPTLVASQIVILHATLLGSFIGMDEILKTASHINSIVYRPIEIFTILAAIFALICLPLMLLASKLANTLKE